MHVYTNTHNLIKHTHTPPCADFSSSCSCLLGTLKPAHVSPCPSLRTPLSPSLPFCYISCVSASLPHPCLCVSFFRLFPHSLCSESVIKCFIMSLWTKWNVAPSSFCTFFSPLCSCCITRAAAFFFFFLPPASPPCNLTVTPNPF